MVRTRDIGLWLTIGKQHRQRGQALLYGVFVLAAGLAALFLLFNTGQLVSEKDKLINTADAVAYSAGVMHARSLNYLAYTNRALIANEIAVAQVVSLASWAKYLENHGSHTAAMNCGTPQYSYPTGKLLVGYSPLCTALFYEYELGLARAQVETMQAAGKLLTPAAELAKTLLQGAQVAMRADMPFARDKVMRQVASANYWGDGSVTIDTIPLTDSYMVFDGGPIAQRYSDNQRQRLAQTTTTAAKRDAFVAERKWRDDSILPSACIAIGKIRFDYVDRGGSTQLERYDDWKADDKAAVHERYVRVSKLGLPSCRTRDRAVGGANQGAKDWGYLGLPSFYDLSSAALAYKPSNSDAKKRDIKPRFIIRVRRDKTQTRTSDARSQIPASETLNAYSSAAAHGLYTAVSGAEVYFERPQVRADGRQELASLFNPYWQVHLVDTSAEAKAARALQGIAP